MSTRTNSGHDSGVLAEKYIAAKEMVILRGFAHEIDWQDSVRWSNLDETTFLREYAWVVLCSGFRESLIRQRFPSISQAFLNWSSASEIVVDTPGCRRKALSIFGHQRKIEAIISTCQLIHTSGFDVFRLKIESEGIRFLKSLPYIGAATAFHLVKNLGLDLAKPDRHLTRIADSLGFDSPQQLCEQISTIVGDRISVVDIVLWRFAVIDADYLKHL